MPLNIKFKIPNFHKSVITDDGDIYLSGGSHPDNIQSKLRSFYRVDFQSQTLNPMADMITPRSSHCLLYMKGFIYAIGGVTNNSAFTRKCERYNPNMNKWE